MIITSFMLYSMASDKVDLVKHNWRSLLKLARPDQTTMAFAKRPINGYKPSLQIVPREWS